MDTREIRAMERKYGRTDRERNLYRQGLKSAASWIRDFDKQLAPVVNGYRFSDMLLCKVNLRRGKPRLVGDVNSKKDLTLLQARRLNRIAGIIWAVDNRCMAVDGPVSRTREEITDKELREIYLLATGKRKC